MSWDNVPVGPRVFVVWDPNISKPMSTQWDQLTVWDCDWDDGATVWGDPTTTWVE